MMSKQISDVFDVEPYKRPTPSAPRPSPETAIEDDAKYAADNIRQLIEIGMNSVKEAADVAEQSEQPRAYEVVSTMIKGLTEMNLSLMDIHQKKRDLNKSTEHQQSSTGAITNNAIFVGTTKDINELIMKRINNVSS